MALARGMHTDTLWYEIMCGHAPAGLGPAFALSIMVYSMAHHPCGLWRQPRHTTLDPSLFMGIVEYGPLVLSVCVSTITVRVRPPLCMIIERLFQSSFKCFIRFESTQPLILAKSVKSQPFSLLSRIYGAAVANESRGFNILIYEIIIQIIKLHKYMEI